MEKKNNSVVIRKNRLILLLAVIGVLVLVAIGIFLVLPALNPGIETVRVEAGKMTCKDKIPLINTNGEVVAGTTLLGGDTKAIAYNKYEDAELEKAPKGLTYTFKGSFEEVVRVDRSTGKETSKTVAGTYRYCFLASAATVAGSYDVTAKVSFYNAATEDAVVIGLVSIPYKVEVVPAQK